MLPQSSHLPMQMIPASLSEFPHDRDIVLYCRSGVRSYHACTFLMQQGFDNVHNMEGGMIAEFWTEWDNVNMLTQLGHFPLPAES